MLKLLVDFIQEMCPNETRLLDCMLQMDCYIVCFHKHGRNVSIYLCKRFFPNILLGLLEFSIRHFWNHCLVQIQETCKNTIEISRLELKKSSKTNIMRKTNLQKPEWIFLRVNFFVQHFAISFHIGNYWLVSYKKIVRMKLDTVAKH